jgi:hypothetical protein
MTSPAYPNVSEAQEKVPDTEWYIEHARRFIGGFSCSADQLRQLSPLSFPDAPHTHPVALFQALYQDNELICVNDDPRLAGKATTMDVASWIEIFFDHGPPVGEGGVWFRINPLMAEEGSGHKSAHTENDVAVFKHLLLESDSLPMGLQLSVLAKLPLPIAAVYLSGGKSVHALVKLACLDTETYREQARIITNKLAYLGFKPANSNPSRYSRLPGAMRGAAVQRLLYLNRNPKPGEAICQQLRSRQ